MLQKQDAIEVIDFVAEGAREQIFAANFKRFTGQILRADGDELRANDIAAKTGNREAAFFLALFAFAVNNVRVYQDDFGFGIFSGSDVDDCDANAYADLRRSQADALRGVHGGKHIFGKFGELGVKLRDGVGRLFEYAIAVLHNGIDFARDGA